MLGSLPAVLRWEGVDHAAALLPDEIIECVAAAVLFGFKLRDDGNRFERNRLGAERLEKFKELRGSKAIDEVLFFFVPRKKNVAGEPLSVEDFRQKMDRDAAFRRAIRAHPRLSAFKERLASNLFAHAVTCVAREDWGPVTRVTYGRVRGDPVKLAAFARMHSDGDF